MRVWVEEGGEGDDGRGRRWLRRCKGGERKEEVTVS